MSIYYELRMQGNLSFKDKTDRLSIMVKDYIKGIENKTIKASESLVVTTELLVEKPLIKKYYGDNYFLREGKEFSFKLENNYTPDEYDLDIHISEKEQDVFIVDWCMGNRNAYDNLEVFTLLLTEYMDDEFMLVHYNERRTTKLNIVKDSLEKYTYDDYEDVSIFDIINELDYSSEEDDICYSEEWLHKGLEIPISKTKFRSFY